VFAALGASPALASGVRAGTSVTNNVTVTYQVGGVAQNEISAADTFTVDRKVDVTVTEVGTATTQVSPGQIAAVTTFQVTNLANATLDFNLSPVAQQVGGTGPRGGTDNFNVNNTRIYADANGNGTYDPGVDVLVTFLDELEADQSQVVFVLSDIPLGRVSGDVAVVTLTATGRESGTGGTLGAVLIQTNGANTAGVDTVFTDGAGATDGSRDAAFSARDDYTVSAAALTVTKTSKIISDPFNNLTNPKLIPGAVVEYCITVANAAGGAPANNVTLSDSLPSETAYLAGFGIKVNGTVSGTTCNADGTNGGSQAGNTVTATLPSVAAGDVRTLVFRVTIN
jgi:uncharacterized repeat protein (TIGR01451 family)